MNPVLREQFEKGMEEGIIQGKQEGIKEGMEQGIGRGKQEGFHFGRLETAKNMLERGVDSEFISEVTGLSLEDIKKLK